MGDVLKRIWAEDEASDYQVPPQKLLARLEQLEREKEHTKQQLAETQRDLAAAVKGSDSSVRLEKRKDKLVHRVMGIGKNHEDDGHQSKMDGRRRGGSPG